MSLRCGWSFFDCVFICFPWAFCRLLPLSRCWSLSLPGERPLEWMTPWMPITWYNFSLPTAPFTAVSFSPKSIDALSVFAHSALWPTAPSCFAWDKAPPSDHLLGQSHFTLLPLGTGLRVANRTSHWTLTWEPFVVPEPLSQSLLRSWSLRASLNLYWFQCLSALFSPNSYLPSPFAHSTATFVWFGMAKRLSVFARMAKTCCLSWSHQWFLVYSFLAIVQSILPRILCLEISPSWTIPSSCVEMLTAVWIFTGGGGSCKSQTFAMFLWWWWIMCPLDKCWDTRFLELGQLWSNLCPTELGWCFVSYESLLCFGILYFWWGQPRSEQDFWVPTPSNTSQ